MQSININTSQLHTVLPHFAPEPIAWVVSQREDARCQGNIWLFPLWNVYSNFLSVSLNSANLSHLLKLPNSSTLTAWFLSPFCSSTSLFENHSLPNSINSFSTMAHFHIYPAYHLLLSYCFRDSRGASTDSSHWSSDIHRPFLMWIK